MRELPSGAVGLLVLVAVGGLVAVVVVAHRTVAWGNLGAMLLALGGLLTMLAVYNARQR